MQIIYSLAEVKTLGDFFREMFLSGRNAALYCTEALKHPDVFLKAIPNSAENSDFRRLARAGVVLTQYSRGQHAPWGLSDTSPDRYAYFATMVSGNTLTLDPNPELHADVWQKIARHSTDDKKAAALAYRFLTRMEAFDATTGLLQEICEWNLPQPETKNLPSQLRHDKRFLQTGDWRWGFAASARLLPEYSIPQPKPEPMPAARSTSSNDNTVNSKHARTEKRMADVGNLIVRAGRPLSLHEIVQGLVDAGHLTMNDNSTRETVRAQIKTHGHMFVQTAASDGRIAFAVRAEGTPANAIPLANSELTGAKLELVRRLIEQAGRPLSTIEIADGIAESQGLTLSRRQLNSLRATLGRLLQSHPDRFTHTRQGLNRVYDVKRI